ncbi:MAG: hypothetical protein CEE38_23025 [Planctomycetes bacterium B3_Pla]|nr:MAG: hypothetical protein CEE38_23025 [Planctomycetes bacterium B3_Pla]
MPIWGIAAAPLAEDDLLIVHIGGKNNACLVAFDKVTGKEKWQALDDRASYSAPKDRWSNIHIVRHEDKVWMFNERGELIISKLSPEGFRQISRAKIIEPTEGQLGRRGGVCWSHPAFAYKRIYARNDRELLCIDLSEKE